MAKRLVFLFLCVFFLSACDRENDAVKIDLQKREPITIEEGCQGITYAYLPQYSHRVSYKRHHPLVQYLAQETNLNICQIFPDTFDDHMKMVGQGKIDISFSNPLIYTKISKRYKARAFARIVEKNNQTSFRGQIICRADNKAIQNLEDCQGKSWIAVDPSSAAGYLFALGHFLKHGLKKEDFREIDFAPGPGAKQEKVVLSVYVGQYDLGTIREGTLDLVQDQVDLSKIKILDYTDWYPGWVYAYRKDLNQDIINKIRKAMFNLDKEKPVHKEVLQKAGFEGIVPAEDKDFDPVRKLYQQLEDYLRD